MYTALALTSHRDEFRTLPSAWLEVNSSDTRPLVHSGEVSAWLPELRTLALSNNNITMSVYLALQSVISLSSLQTLDFSGNALSGNMEGSLEAYYCEGGDLNACDTAILSTRSVLTILLLASNFIEGGLQADALPRSLFVLTLSENMLYGPVPEDFSQLSVFFAGEESLEAPLLSYSTASFVCLVLCARDMHLDL